jgi:murein DD-endopeptidase MepM/ murein hydrolase activator NlpD
MGNHRAERRSSRGHADEASYPAAGKRSAGRRVSRSGSRVGTPSGLVKTSIPAIPTVIGAAALIVAGAGAVGLSGGGLSDSGLNLSAGANVYQATAVGPRADERTRAISRDSDRQALQDAADRALQDAAEKQNRQRNAALAKLAKNAEKRASEIEKNQWVLPVQGYRLTATFGMGGGLWSRNHTGLDFAAPIGSSLVAVANGVVTETGYDGSYGNKTVLTLADGTEIWYCHQNSIGVNVGDTVTAGTQIGELGSTGNSTGPHLHLEVRPGGGDPVDPFSALIFHGLNP